MKKFNSEEMELIGTVLMVSGIVAIVYVAVTDDNYFIRFAPYFVQFLTISNDNTVVVVAYILYYLHMALCIFISYCGIRIRQYSKRMEIPEIDFDEYIAADGRPPVLYLRSFRDDKLLANTVIFNIRGMNSEEEILTTYFNKYGPFVAIGQPGDRFPQLGAVRTYLDHGEWQSYVLSLMESASLIILRAGFSEGFWWELEQAIKQSNLKKIIIIIPFRRSKYNKFIKAVREKFDIGLPEFSGKKTTESEMRGIVYFNNDDVPVFVGLKGTHYIIKSTLRITFNIIGARYFFKKRNDMELNLQKLLDDVILAKL